MTIFGNFFKGNPEIERTFMVDDKSEKQFAEINRRMNPIKSNKVDTLVDDMIEKHAGTIEDKDVYFFEAEKMIERNEIALDEMNEMLEKLYEILEDARLKPIEKRTPKDIERIEKIVAYGKDLLRRIKDLPKVNEELRKKILARNERIFRMN